MLSFTRYLCPLKSFTKRTRCLSTLTPGVMKVSATVQEALKSGKPVVALESTIITHGMPYPSNLRTAQEVEAIVKENDCVPATVAVLDGTVHVGLTSSQLQHLAEAKTCVKISRRDLPPSLCEGITGGTTVSATMVAAHLAGIPVFVTGGIGGVHRGAATSFDISSDLTELSRTPIMVVSAGVKSILDIGLTLEYLETQGVCVATFGATRDFPAFFVPISGHSAPYNVTSPLQAARLICGRDDLGLQSAILLAVPIPGHLAAEGGVIEKAITVALEETRSLHITGKDVTPYVLKKVNELTEGASLKANIALVKNNAFVGSQVAVELSRLKASSQRLCSTASSSHQDSKQQSDSLS